MTEQTGMDPAAPTGEPDGGVGGEPEPVERKARRLQRRPHSSKHVYVVLAADAAAGHDGATYLEVGLYRATSQETAKRHAVADARDELLDDLGKWILQQLDAKGIYLQAVPLQSWEHRPRPTRYERPAPKLVIA